MKRKTFRKNSDETVNVRSKDLQKYFNKTYSDNVINKKKIKK